MSESSPFESPSSFASTQRRVSASRVTQASTDDEARQPFQQSSADSLLSLKNSPSLTKLKRKKSKSDNEASLPQSAVASEVTELSTPSLSQATQAASDSGQNNPKAAQTAASETRRSPDLDPPPNELGCESQRTEPLEEKRFLLKIIQQPSTGSAFGESTLSRLALAPPLVIELQLVDGDGKVLDVSAETPFIFCQLSLVTTENESADMILSQGPSGLPETPERASTSSVSTSPASGRSRSTPSRRRNLASRQPSASSRQRTTPEEVTDKRMLYGTLTANPQEFESPQGDERCYFLFPEVSVKAPGRFKLKCALRRWPRPPPAPPTTGTLAETETDVFHVVPSIQYVAPHITDLTRHFARLGAALLLPPGQNAD